MKFGLFIPILGALWIAELASASAPLKASFMQHELRASDTEENTFQASVVEEYAAEPEGGRAPLVPHNAAKWGESKLSKPLQWTLAGAWVFMLASLPFICPILEQKPATKTQMIVGATMLVVLFGGFYLFTNIILFQSVHFEKIRPLTVVECIYFMSQIITTVGYGDITPAKVRGQVFVGMYVLGALFLIAMLVSEMTQHLVKMAQNYKNKRFVANNPDYQEDMNMCTLLKPQRPSLTPLLSSMAVFGVIDICWIAFFSQYPGEGKTVFQAAYMSVITLSSVGLGYFTPVTEGGMIFGAFFMMFGTGALVGMIGNFTDLMVKLNEYERFKDESQTEALALLKKNMKENSEQVTEMEFWRFSLLQTKMVKAPVLDHIREAFGRLNPKNGVVTLKDIESVLSQPVVTPRDDKTS